jgi:hypothetical protein
MVQRCVLAGEVRHCACNQGRGVVWGVWGTSWCCSHHVSGWLCWPPTGVHGHMRVEGAQKMIVFNAGWLEVLTCLSVVCVLYCAWLLCVTSVQG